MLSVQCMATVRVILPKNITLPLQFKGSIQLEIILQLQPKSYILAITKSFTVSSSIFIAASFLRCFHGIHIHSLYICTNCTVVLLFRDNVLIIVACTCTAMYGPCPGSFYTMLMKSSRPLLKHDPCIVFSKRKVKLYLKVSSLKTGGVIVELLNGIMCCDISKSSS